MEETRDQKILRQFKDVMINGYINDDIEYKMNDDKKIKYRTNNFTSQWYTIINVNMESDDIILETQENHTINIQISKEKERKAQEKLKLEKELQEKKEIEELKNEISSLKKEIEELEE